MNLVWPFMCSFQFLGLASTFWTSSPLPCWTPGTILSETIWSVSLSEHHMATLASIIKEVDKDGLKGQQDRKCAQAGIFQQRLLLVGWCTTSSRCLSNWFSRVFKVHQMKSLRRPLSLQPLPGDFGPSVSHPAAPARCGQRALCVCAVGCTPYVCGSGTACLGIPSWKECWETTLGCPSALIKIISRICVLYLNSLSKFKEKEELQTHSW